MSTLTSPGGTLTGPAETSPEWNLLLAVLTQPPTYIGYPRTLDGPRVLGITLLKEA